jgi:hypothetical protein
LHDSGRAAKISAARLILFTFVGPPPDDRRNKARHIDDNVENNRLDNLIWGTQKENIQDAVRNGRRTTYGEFVKSGKLTQIEIEFIRDNCTPWSRKNGVRALANRYNVHESTIYNIIHNLTWQQAAQ